MKLDQYLQDWAGRSFSWDGATCVHFAAGWVDASRQVDVLSHLRPLPTTRGGWARLAAREGGAESLVTQALGQPPVSVAFAKAGHIVLFKGHQVGWRLGVCTGRLSAVLSEEGVAFVPTLEGEVAWAT